MKSLLSSRFTGPAVESPIRKMFNYGFKLRQQYGPDSVCDFSIGNPDVAGPPELKKAMMAIAEEADKPMAFMYTPTAGLADVLKVLAEYLSKEQGYQIGADDVMMSGGASGVINAVFRSILDPGDNVVGVAPYFLEYRNWAGNFMAEYRGVLVKPDFSMDLPAMEKAIDAKTRAVIYNSPHNPTGYVYSKQEIQGLVDIVAKKSKEFGRPILIIADEPYRFLTFGGEDVPSILPLYDCSCVTSSFAKNMSLPGERVGYLIANHKMPEKDKFVGAVTSSSYALGHVNAPIVGQKLLLYTLGHNTDVNIYAKRRELMADVLTRAGYQFNLPKGAFYFFPKAPGDSDVKFCDVLAEQRVLSVPGSAFGMDGYFRLTFCVGEDVIKRSFDGFLKARQIIEGK